MRYAFLLLFWSLSSLFLFAQEDSKLKELDALAVAAFEQRDYKLALSYTKERMEYAKNIGNDSIYIEGLNNLAVLSYQLGDYEPVLGYAQEAADARRQKNGIESPEYLVSLENLTSFQQAFGKYEEVEKSYLFILPKYEKLAEKDKKYLNDIARLRSNLAALYKTLARYEEAVLLQQEALRAHEQAQGKENLGVNQIVVFYEPQLACARCATVGSSQVCSALAAAQLRSAGCARTASHR